MVNLRIPGPTPCPDDILEAVAGQMINHRGPEFQDMIFRITEGLKRVYETKNDVFILTGSGTGAMEAAIVNVLSPGDHVLSLSIGVFGDRFAQIAEAYGASVTRMSAPQGEAIDLGDFRKALVDNPSVKAVIVTHNETSTGVTNDIGGICDIAKEFDKLTVVDAVSSLSSLPFHTDIWGCDVAVSGSQKGWNVPPGLSFVSVSDRAWDAFSSATMPRFYWDFGRAKSYLERGQTPWTPAISIFYGLDVSLGKMFDEGLENIYSRHLRIAGQTRDGIKEMGLELLANELTASNTVTAVKSPEGLDVKNLVKRMQSDHNVVLAGGQGSLDGKIFRIGHMGYVKDQDIDEVLGSLGQLLPNLGFQQKEIAAKG